MMAAFSALPRLATPPSITIAKADPTQTALGDATHGAREHGVPDQLPGDDHVKLRERIMAEMDL